MPTKFPRQKIRSVKNGGQRLPTLHMQLRGQTPLNKPQVLISERTNIRCHGRELRCGHTEPGC